LTSESDTEIGQEGLLFKGLLERSLRCMLSYLPVENNTR
jgi:hypothetical protein